MSSPSSDRAPSDYDSRAIPLLTPARKFNVITHNYKQFSTSPIGMFSVTPGGPRCPFWGGASIQTESVVGCTCQDERTHNAWALCACARDMERQLAHCLSTKNSEMKMRNNIKRSRDLHHKGSPIDSSLLNEAVN